MIVENKSIPQTIPYLFYANKSDIKGCCSFEEIVETLELKTLNRHYHITCCSGINGQGVEEGIEWLAGIIKLKLDKAR
jgi:signal recognition particle receptor subunit beta